MSEPTSFDLLAAYIVYYAVFNYCTD